MFVREWNGQAGPMRRDEIQRRRRDIFVEIQTEDFSAPSGAASSGRRTEYAAPTELEMGLVFEATNMPRLRRWNTEGAERADFSKQAFFPKIPFAGSKSNLSRKYLKLRLGFADTAYSSAKSSLCERIKPRTGFPFAISCITQPTISAISIIGKI